MNEPENIVALYRVSTDEQGKSGLGLSAQKETIRLYAERIGGIIVAEYEEVESGTLPPQMRPTLRAAVGHAKRGDMTLCVAKLDRLLRSSSVKAYVDEVGVKVVPCDYPDAPPILHGILAVMATDEAKKIRARTRDALAAYKRDARVSKAMQLRYPDGVPDDVREATAGKLGSHLPQCAGKLTQEGREKGAAKSAENRFWKAVAADAETVPWMRRMRNDEGLTYSEIAAALNAKGHFRPNRKPWSKSHVWNAMKLADKAESNPQWGQVKPEPVPVVRKVRAPLPYRWVKVPVDPAPTAEDDGAAPPLPDVLEP